MEENQRSNSVFSSDNDGKDMMYIGDKMYKSINLAISQFRENNSFDLFECLVKNYRDNLVHFVGKEEEFKKTYLMCIHIKRKSDISKRLSNILFKAYKEIKKESLYLE